MKLMRNVVAGAVAGAAGTLAMDLVWYGRYRRDGGEDSFPRWELAAGVASWDQVSAPGQVGLKVLRTVTGRTPPDEWARTTMNVVHWATGIGWGIQYGLVASRASKHQRLFTELLGPAVWLSSYVVLPLAKVYKPIWEYDSRTLAKDLSAHLAYGSATSRAFAILTRGRRRR